MALRLFVHDSDAEGNSGSPLGMVAGEALAVNSYYWENFKTLAQEFGYPTVEEALADLLDSLGML
jgi:hypothetical protein